MKPIIKVENLSKHYVIGGKQDSYSTLRESIVNAARVPLNALRGRGKNGDERFWALKDLNFQIMPGEVVGIIGRNGAGKSTLLKILSRITQPTEGRIELYGRVGSLLEVGTGFHPELTGRENIYLNGAILGMRRDEIAKKFDEIVDFAEVEGFLDTPVKRYSSGMYTRLAFSVAAHLESEILIVDEVLAVGDQEFQKKCFGKMDQVSKGEGRTVLLVSHNLTAVKNFCQFSILLEKGRLICQDKTSEVIKLYTSKNDNVKKHFFLDDFSRSRGAKNILVSEVIFDADEYHPDSSLELKIKLKKNLSARIKNINLAIFIFDSLANVVYQLSTLFDENLEVEFSEDFEYAFKLESLNLNPGIYNVGVWLQGNGIEQDYVENVISFEVQAGNIYNSVNPLIVSLVQKEFEFYYNEI